MILNLAQTTQLQHALSGLHSYRSSETDPKAGYEFQNMAERGGCKLGLPPLPLARRCTANAKNAAMNVR
jgi:hypothetical protein